MILIRVLFLLVFLVYHSNYDGDEDNDDDDDNEMIMCCDAGWWCEFCRGIRKARKSSHKQPNPGDSICIKTDKEK